jgi:flavodoxin I
MKKTLVVFGSSTGNCQGFDDINIEKLAEYDNLVLGTSTWGSGEMQDDWYDGVGKLKDADLSGKTVALFGCGDADSYSDTFCGGMREIYDTVKASGANILGGVDAAEYTYDDSESVVDGKFVGLALDVNEDETKSEGRIDKWIQSISNSL